MMGNSPRRYGFHPHSRTSDGIGQFGWPWPLQRLTQLMDALPHITQQVFSCVKATCNERHNVNEGRGISKRNDHCWVEFETCCLPYVIYILGQPLLLTPLSWPFQASVVSVQIGVLALTIGAFQMWVFLYHFTTSSYYTAPRRSSSPSLLANRGIRIQMHVYYSLPCQARCARWDKHADDIDVADKHVRCRWSLLSSNTPMCQTEM